MKIDLANYGPGRPPKPETMETMEKMVRCIRRSPGIRSAKLARELDISSLRCSTLARRLEAKGVVRVERTEDNALAYHLIAD